MMVDSGALLLPTGWSTKGSSDGSLTIFTTPVPPPVPPMGASGPAS